jgi:hypothetical protein
MFGTTSHALIDLFLSTVFFYPEGGTDVLKEAVDSGFGSTSR